MLEINTRETFRVFGIFTGVLVVLFFLDFGFVRLAQKSWNSGMYNALGAILDEKQPGVWRIDHPIKIDSPFATSAQAFEVQNMQNGKRSRAIIVRTTTIFGPYPAVFIYDSASGSEFIGYACVSGRIKKLLEENGNSVIRDYWAVRIKSIIGAEKEAK
ncbi:MAG: hypothetical protein HDR56_08060 [Treponema sp.]|nr:hypothetical protein [Treponema sp.]